MYIGIIHITHAYTMMPNLVVPCSTATSLQPLKKVGGGGKNKSCTTNLK